MKERNPGVRDKIIPKSTENLLHQKRERCKGNRQKERGAVATDYRDKGRGAYREAHMTLATQENSYMSGRNRAALA